jgi:penicillin-binding protein 2
MEALEAVVGEDGGTARRSRVAGVRIAGKTGTAQVVHLKQTEDLEEHEIPIQFRDHAWFAAVAPIPDPEIAIAVLVEHGGPGGSAAAPIAQQVLAKYFEKKAAKVAPIEAAAIPDEAPAGEIQTGDDEGSLVRN